jgi:hypothetical protein
MAHDRFQGIRGLRTAEDPCVAYLSVQDVTPEQPSWQGCLGDGHYLCASCVHLDREARERAGWC